MDWPQFLTQHNIPYITTGKVGRNDIGCQCPFCGNADSGHNMSISLVNRGWYCWKQPDGHRGKTPHRLIQALIGCSYLDAEAIVKRGASFVPNDGDFLDRLKGLFAENSAPVETRQLRMPAEFRPIEDMGKGRMFVMYLQKRGFDYDDIPKLVKDYNLWCCVEGNYSSRLIFLITIDGELVSWTGRHIGSSAVRYMSLAAEDSRLSLKQTVLWYDMLLQSDKGKTLVVCEGPFDALKVNYLGQPYGIHATCVYGSSLTDTQLDLLESLSHYSNRILLLDADAAIRYDCNISGGIGILASLGFKTRILPSTIKDPGEFNRTSFAQQFGYCFT